MPSNQSEIPRVAHRHVDVEGLRIFYEHLHGAANPEALALAQDVPAARVPLFDTGHFALEERLDEIAPLVASFLERTWSPSRTHHVAAGY
jgi:hypothetical protein